LLGIKETSQLWAGQMPRGEAYEGQIGGGIVIKKWILNHGQYVLEGMFITLVVLGVFYLLFR